jgi:hypothetical protein
MTSGTGGSRLTILADGWVIARSEIAIPQHSERLPSPPQSAVIWSQQSDSTGVAVPGTTQITTGKSNATAKNVVMPKRAMTGFYRSPVVITNSAQRGRSSRQLLTEFPATSGRHFGSPCYSRKLMMRAAAIGLLLLMVLDLGADFLQGETGELAIHLSATGDSEATKSLRSDDDADRTPSSDQKHECFCCCTHIERGEIVNIHVTIDATPGFVHLSPSLPDGHPVHIYHPPLQLS